jgi:predicted RNA-binding protein with PUA-like domain
MAYWLMKSEPDEFSIDDLAANPNSPWDGVRNYQARNFIREMKSGDRVLFYHSSCKVPGVAGIAEITSAPYPDTTAIDPENTYFDPKSTLENNRWTMIDVSHLETFKHPVSLNSIKQQPELASMLLVAKGGRLSVMPVEQEHFEHIRAMGNS